MTQDSSENSEKKWLGALPSTWRIMSPKALFVERREPCLADDVHLTPSQKYGVLPQVEYMALTGNSVVLNLQGQDKMKHVAEDDFIIHLRSFQGGLERSRIRGKVSTAYTVLVPQSKVVSGYYQWLLKSDGYVQELRTTTNQLRDGQSIKYRDFAKVSLPVPPKEEQQAIAAYLDREVAQIDELITEQQQLIGMLEERRGAVVSHAVSEGELIRFRRVIESLRQGWSPNCEPWPADGVNEWGVLKVGCSNGGRFNPSQNKLLPDGVEPRKEFVVRHGEIVMSRANTKDLVGSASMVDRDYPKLMLSDLNYGITLKEYVDSNFISYALSSTQIRHHISMASKGSSPTMQKISRRNILDLQIRIPSLLEQRRIVLDLDEQTRKIDTLISESERLIELSQERRSALITAAVTGQIDIPQEA